MTCVAVIVVPLVVPSTRTVSPVVMALAEVELVPFWYVVEDASSTVTFRPVNVNNVKPDLDMLPTVPAAPPAAGPDRALDPTPPDPRPPAEPLPAAVGEGDVAAGEGDVAVAEEPQAAESPITEVISTVAMIH